MLRSLRWKLALLYFGSALGIVMLLVAGTYAMLNRFMIQQIDLALQYKMAAQFKLYGISLPVELVSAEKLWLEENPHTSPAVPQVTVHATPTASPEPTQTAAPQPLVIIGSPDDESNGDDDGLIGETEGDGELQATDLPVVADESHDEVEGSDATPHLDDDNFDSRLSSIFIVPVSTPQGTFNGIQQAASPIDEDIDASQHALSLGYDVRTVHLQNGTHVRLLTYRTSGIGTPTVIQIGRLLDDQDRLLQLYLVGLILLGIIASFMISILSWMLSGRSIKPAQKAWDQQQLFISNASHELRAPLTVIRADAEFGLRSNHRDDREAALRDVVDEVAYMDRMVEDLLLLSRLDAHHLKLGLEEIVVSDLLGDLCKEVEKMASAHNVQLVVNQAGGTIRADRQRLRQILLILIDNALRFSKKNDLVELDAIQSGRKVEISVKDHGPGIAPEHLPHLFERFYQATSGNTEDAHGNGLGLSIAKGLMELQGGVIQVESRVGEGTRVILRFPTAP